MLQTEKNEQPSFVGMQVRECCEGLCVGGSGGSGRSSKGTIAALRASTQSIINNCFSARWRPPARLRSRLRDQLLQPRAGARRLRLPPVHHE